MKLLVCITVPAISESYDVNLPADEMLHQLLPLVSHTVEELSGQRYIASGEEVLCHQRKRTTLKYNETLRSAGVINGDRLFLM